MMPAVGFVRARSPRRILGEQLGDGLGVGRSTGGVDAGARDGRMSAHELAGALGTVVAHGGEKALGFGHERLTRLGFALERGPGGEAALARQRVLHIGQLGLALGAHTGESRGVALAA